MRAATFIVLVGLVALCAMPARGDHIQLTKSLEYALTPIDSVPTKEELTALIPQNTASELAALATNTDTDFGVRLRAIRALPQFCLPACFGSAPHQALVTLLDTPPPAEPPAFGKWILLMRATIEAIGIAKSGSTFDVDRLVPFLDNPSRDIRAATAFALRDLCLQTAVSPLRNRYNVEIMPTGVPQVRLAISAALRDLGTCSN